MFIAINRSLDNIEYWLEDIKKHCQETPYYALIANKIDLREEREITTSDGDKIARNNEMQYYEVSAKTGENISKMFYGIAETIEEDNNFTSFPGEKPSIKISDAKSVS